MSYVRFLWNPNYQAHGDSSLRKYSAFTINFTHLLTLFHLFLLKHRSLDPMSKHMIWFGEKCKSLLDRESPRSSNVNNGWNDGSTFLTACKRKGKDRPGKTGSGFVASHVCPFPPTPEKLFYTWPAFIGKCRKEWGVRKHDRFCIIFCILAILCMPRRFSFKSSQAVPNLRFTQEKKKLKLIKQLCLSACAFKIS